MPAKVFLIALCTLIGLVSGEAMAEDTQKARVTGSGGVFILSKGDGKALAEWYAEHLGIQLEDWGGAILQWQEDTANDNGMTVWGSANHDSEWFSPSESKFMINYRVDDLERLIEQLQAADIEIIGGPEYHENGIFAWIMDPDGNKVELWQPMAWDDANKKPQPEEEE